MIHATSTRTKELITLCLTFPDDSRLACVMMFDDALFHTIPRQHKLERKVNVLQHALSSESLALFPDFQQRLEVLRRYVLYDVQTP